MGHQIKISLPLIRFESLPLKKSLSFFVIVFLLQLKCLGQYCTSDKRYTEVEYFTTTELTVGSNIQFAIANDHLGQPDTLLMDLYYPNVNVDKSPKRPFVLLFHGGGFSSGDKQSGDIKDLCIHLAKRGFVCASVNYRLEYDFSEYGQYKARYRAIQDGHAALRFVVNNAAAVRIDTSWLFVGGQSAGSLLALGMVYADQAELDSIALLYNTTSTSAELGGLYTSGNALTTTYTVKGIFNNWGGVTASEIDANELLPTIAFHGEKDTTVYIDADNSFLHYTLNGSRALHSVLIAKAVCSEITIDTLGGHGIYRNASSVFRAGRASCFFKSIFCNSCSNFYSTDSIPALCSNPATTIENTSAPVIRLYPNPFDNRFSVEGLQGNLEIAIYNSNGQLVARQQTDSNTVLIDLPPGLYFVKVQQSTTNTIFSAKLLKH